MNCPACKKDVSGDMNYCPECGRLLKGTGMSPRASYGGYLPIAGWIIIAAGVIFSAMILSKMGKSFGRFGGRVSNDVIMAVLAYVLGCIFIAWLFFGLHKVLLKVTRIEQAMGIEGLTHTPPPAAPNPGQSPGPSNAPGQDGNVKPAPGTPTGNPPG